LLIFSLGVKLQRRPNRSREGVYPLSQTLGAVLLVAAVAAFFLSTSIWRSHLDGDRSGSGRILLPKKGEQVARPLRIEGELSRLAHGYHAWLALESENMLFPVEPELATGGGHFAAEIAVERIPGEPFSLLLLLVGAKGQRAIEYWLLQGGLGEGYPGFDLIPGASELDTVRNILTEPSVGARRKSR
jgi:hypothetical protein